MKQINVAILGLLVGVFGALADAPPLGAPPGIVIAASSDPEKIFMFSPSIVVLSDGSYLVSYESQRKTIIMASTDRGKTWLPRAKLSGQKWSTLFVHKSDVFLIGVSSPNGGILLRRSKDAGHRWTEPEDEKSGLLARGTFHCGPTPVLVHGDRIWRAFEEYAPKAPTRRFKAFVMSASVDSDLLSASSWTRSNSLQLEQKWLRNRNVEWLEGNVVATPDGEIRNILRVDSHPAEGAAMALPGILSDIPRFEVAAMFGVSKDGSTVRFDPSKDFIHFIGAEGKFTIRFDETSGRFWTLVNKISNPDSGTDWTHSPHHQRNVIALTSSPDLREWVEHYRPLSYRAGSVVVKKGSRVGFQYMDWQFEGDDIIAVCRMSWDGANYHDSNMITFHRIKNFRKLTLDDSPADLAEE